MICEHMQFILFDLLKQQRNSETLFAAVLRLTLIPSTNVVCFLCLLIYSIAVQSRLYHGSKHYDSIITQLPRSSLIWVHIVCNIGYFRSESDEREDKTVVPYSI